MSACEKPTFYSYRLGCRCDECRELVRAYAAAWRAKNQPRKTVDVDRAPVVERIDQLRAFGMSYAEIDRAAGLPASTAQGIIRNRSFPMVCQDNANAIMGVRKRAITPTTRISRESMDRRIVEMLADGYSIEAQSRISGVLAITLSRYANQSIRTANAKTVARFIAETDKQLGEWNREPRQAARTRAKNLAQQAAKLVASKWGAGEQPFEVTTTDSGFTVRVYDREVAAERIISPNGKPLKRRAADGNGLAWVYRIGESEVVGKKAAIEAAYELAR